MIYRVLTCFNHPFGGLSDFAGPSTVSSYLQNMMIHQPEMLGHVGTTPIHRLIRAKETNALGILMVKTFEKSISTLCIMCLYIYVEMVH
jgi:hypothetical protein